MRGSFVGETVAYVSREIPLIRHGGEERTGGGSGRAVSGSFLVPAGLFPSDPRRCTVTSMWTVLIILLVAWAVLSVIGFAIKGLVWLAIIGLILFVGTIIFGMIRNAARRK